MQIHMYITYISYKTKTITHKYDKKIAKTNSLTWNTARKRQDT